MSNLMDRFDEHHRKQHESKELQELRHINRGIGQLVILATDILKVLNQKPILTTARTILMPKEITVGDVAQAVIQGFDQKGNPFNLDASYGVQYVASAPSDVSFATPAPDGSVAVTGVAADTGDAISANITRPDGVVIPASADTLVIDPFVPVLTTAKVVLQ